MLPRARGDAAKALQDAEGFRQQKIAIATGEAERFLAIQREYVKSRDITRKRLFLEAMEDILPGISKILGDPGEIIIMAPNKDRSNVVPVPVQGGNE